MALLAGFELARAEPNRFLIYLLNHSDTATSSTWRVRRYSSILKPHGINPQVNQSKSTRVLDDFEILPPAQLVTSQSFLVLTRSAYPASLVVLVRTIKFHLRQFSDLLAGFSLQPSVEPFDAHVDDMINQSSDSS